MAASSAWWMIMTCHVFFVFHWLIFAVRFGFALVAEFGHEYPKLPCQHLVFLIVAKIFAWLAFTRTIVDPTI
jgi:hypothetical protein